MCVQLPTRGYPHPRPHAIHAGYHRHLGIKNWYNTKINSSRAEVAAESKPQFLIGGSWRVEPIRSQLATKLRREGDGTLKRGGRGCEEDGARDSGEGVKDKEGVNGQQN